MAPINRRFYMEEESIHEDNDIEMEEMTEVIPFIIPWENIHSQEIRNNNHQVNYTGKLDSLTV